MIDWKPTPSGQAHDKKPKESRRSYKGFRILLTPEEAKAQQEAKAKEQEWLEEMIHENELAMKRPRSCEDQGTSWRSPYNTIRRMNREMAKDRVMFEICMNCKVHVYDILAKPMDTEGNELGGACDVCTKSIDGLHSFKYD